MEFLGLKVPSLLDSGSMVMLIHEAYFWVGFLVVKDPNTVLEPQYSTHTPGPLPDLICIPGNWV